MPDTASMGLLVVAILLAAVVVFSGVRPLFVRRRQGRAARTRMSAAVTEATDAKRPSKERAAAFVKAGRAALDELGRARLAARYAEWAHRLEPADDEVVSLVVAALTKARRYHALERLLWISVDRAPDARSSPALAPLVALYAGGLRRPERATALAKLSAR